MKMSIQQIYATCNQIRLNQSSLYDSLIYEILMKSINSYRLNFKKTDRIEAKILTTPENVIETMAEQLQHDQLTGLKNDELMLYTDYHDTTWLNNYFTVKPFSFDKEKLNQNQTQIYKYYKKLYDQAQQKITGNSFDDTEIIDQLSRLNCAFQILEQLLQKNKAVYLKLTEDYVPIEIFKKLMEPKYRVMTDIGPHETPDNAYKIRVQFRADFNIDLNDYNQGITA